MKKNFNDFVSKSNVTTKFERKVRPSEFSRNCGRGKIEYGCRVFAKNVSCTSVFVKASSSMNQQGRHFFLRLFKYTHNITNCKRAGLYCHPNIIFITCCNVVQVHNRLQITFVVFIIT